MNTEVENILSLLIRTFEKDAWHGPTVKEVLNDVTPELALKRLNHTHSIIELVAHMTSWRIFVVQKLDGNIYYKVEEHMNFPETENWAKTYEELLQSQSKLIDILKNFPSSKLGDVVPQGSHSYTFFTLLHGIIHHDLYHIGQIALIKKSFE